MPLGSNRASKATIRRLSNAHIQRSTDVAVKSLFGRAQISSAAASAPKLNINGRHSNGDPTRHQRATAPNNSTPNNV